MSDTDFEFTAENGDQWFVRDCNGDHAGRTVVEKFFPGKDVDEDDPAQIIDVPPELCLLIGKALIARAEYVKALAAREE